MSKYEWEQAGKHNPWGKKRVRGTHCTKGHEFTEENTFIRAYDNARVCRECRKQYAREKYQRNKVKNNGVARPKKDKPVQFEVPDYLRVKAVAQESWIKLNIGLAQNQNKCANKVDEYSGEGTISIDSDAAEQMCYGCPLIKACYDYAVADDITWGIWGGVNFSKEEQVELDGF